MKKRLLLSFFTVCSFFIFSIATAQTTVQSKDYSRVEAAIEKVLNNTITKTPDQADTCKTLLCCFRRCREAYNDLGDDQTKIFKELEAQCAATNGCGETCDGCTGDAKDSCSACYDQAIEEFMDYYENFLKNCRKRCYIDHSDGSNNTGKTSGDNDLMNENSIVESLVVYPIPAQKFLNVEFVSENNDPISILIFNNLGQMVKNERIASEEGYNLKTININGFPNGFYSVIINTGNKTITKKIAVLNQ